MFALTGMAAIRRPPTPNASKHPNPHLMAIRTPIMTSAPFRRRCTLPHNRLLPAKHLPRLLRSIPHIIIELHRHMPMQNPLTVPVKVTPVIELHIRFFEFMPRHEYVHRLGGGVFLRVAHDFEFFRRQPWGGADGAPGAVDVGVLGEAALGVVFSEGSSLATSRSMEGAVVVVVD